MTALEQAIYALRAIDNQNDLNRIADEWKQCMARLNRKNIRAFVVGDQAKFTSSSGSTVTGVIEKINRKNIIIKVKNSGMFGATVYRVPASMLEAV